MASKWSEADAERLRGKLTGELTEKPLRAGVIGVSGVGKSSTFNTLFKSKLPISHTTACTKEFTEVPVDLKINSGPAAGEPVQLLFYDAPGLGEDVRRDPEYLDMYRRHLPTCDVILWVTAARNRAVALEQTYLERFADLHDRMVFGLSQVDLVEPRDWRPGFPIPSREQQEHIEEIAADRAERFGAVLGRKIEIIPYSNYQLYNLETLFTNLLRHCADGRKWIYAVLKDDFNRDDVLATNPDVGQPRAAEPHRDDGRGLWDTVRRLTHRDQPIPAAELLALGTEVLRTLRGLSGRQSQFDDLLRQTIGRNDVADRPLEVDELRKLEDRVHRERRDRARRGV
jgi:predicted GTPase